MKTFKCLCGEDILVDDEDYEKITARSLTWSCKGRGRVEVTIGGKARCLSWMVLGKPDKGFVTDHRDLNIHNNQSDNLRFATNQQNSANRLKFKTSKNLFKGVNRDEGCRLPFRAYIYHNAIRVDLGRFYTIEEGALAYNVAAKRLFGEFARPNIVVGPTPEIMDKVSETVNKNLQPYLDSL